MFFCYAKLFKFYHKFINLRLVLLFGMASLEIYSISSTVFASTFKLIRHQVSSYLGQLRLMQNLKSKQKVFVQDAIFTSNNQLDIFMADAQLLIELNQSPFLNKFVGYSIQINPQNDSGKVYLIYEMKTKLSQILRNVSIIQEKIKHNQSNSKHLGSVHELFSQFGQKSLLNLLNSASIVFLKLEHFGLVHRCLVDDSIMVQNFGQIDQKFSIVFTRQTFDAVDLILQKKLNIQLFNLCQSQIKRLNLLQKCKNKDSQNYLNDIEEQYKINFDFHSLGLILLRILCKSLKQQQFNSNLRLYKMNKHYQIQLDKEKIHGVFRLLKGKGKYSKNILNVIQFLVFQSEKTSISQIQSKINFEGKSEGIQKYQINVSSLKKSRKSNKSNTNYHTPYHTPIEKKMLISKAQQNSNSEQNITSVFSPILYDANEENFLQTIKKAILFDTKGNYHPNITQKKFKDGSKYIGQYNPQKNCKEGQGIYFYFQGDIYGGKWKNDQLNGYGMYLFANGDKYQGDVLQGKKEGYGVYSYSNGNMYKGFWKEDYKNGNGQYLFANGDIYQGQFEKGARHGQGTFKWFQGDIYKGQFFKGNKDGKGILTKKNGDQIRGFWIKDELIGQIQINFHQKKSFFKGQYKNNQLNGRGIFKCLNQFSYDGLFKQNYYEGHSQINFSNGDHYVGMTYKNKMHGEGCYYFSNQGYELQTNWYQNNPNGKSILKFSNGTKIFLTYNMSKPSKIGKIQYSNGQKYEGQIGNNGRHGRGRYYLKDGSVIQAIFEDNKLIKTITN